MTQPREVTIRPIIHYPQNAEPGKSYLMTIDVELVISEDGWPYDREEYTIFCNVDGEPWFQAIPNGDSSIVIHRFGGTYGGAQFILNTLDRLGTGKITIDMTNGWGSPFDEIVLHDIQIGASTLQPGISAEWRPGQFGEQLLKPRHSASPGAKPPSVPLDVPVPAADHEALPMTPAEEVYLRILREEATKVYLLEDSRSASTLSQSPPSLANVYVDLNTTAVPTFELVCDRLRVPEVEREYFREAVLQLDTVIRDGQRAAEEPRAMRVLYALVNDRTRMEESVNSSDWALGRWVSNADVLQDAFAPVSALEALSRTYRLVLLGDPGSGKSTFVNYLAYTMAGALLGESSEWTATLADRFTQPLFPLSIIARRWSSSLAQGAAANTERVYEALLALPGGISRADLVARLDQPGVLLMIDGLDEASADYEGDRTGRRRVLLESIQAFGAAHPTCRILVTSRIRPYQMPWYQLVGWPDATLARLDDPRIERFIMRYYEEQTRVKKMDATRAATLRARLWQAVQWRRDLHEMAEVPLLLTMLAVVNKSYGLPENRAELYHQCTEQLLWNWEKVKAEEGKTRSLDHLLDAIEPHRTRLDIERVLWRLTFAAHQLSGKRTADLRADDLRKALAEIPPQRSGNWDWADSVVKFMQDRGGLLSAVDDSTLTFPHRSFQEYLAARQLLEMEDPALEAVKLARDDIWREVILLACGHLAIKGPSSLWRTMVDELAFAVEEDAEAWQAAILAGAAWLEYGPEKVEGRAGKRLHADLPPILTHLLQDHALPSARRMEAGLILADLDILPPDLDAFITLAAGRLDYPCRIGKYPITNTQFQRFLESGGYDEKRWWSEEGWEKRLSETWNEPRYWHDKRLNGRTQPVVGISIYEATAYCVWLTETLRKSGNITSSEMVHLPTEAEWSMFAGPGRNPWGDDFDPSRCNSQESNLAQTTPVNMYPAGASPDGVYDLCGNVWEWTDTPDTSSRGYFATGGAFDSSRSEASSHARLRLEADQRARNLGFRVVIAPSSESITAKPEELRIEFIETKDESRRSQLYDLLASDPTNHPFLLNQHALAMVDAIKPTTEDIERAQEVIDNLKHRLSRIKEISEAYAETRLFGSFARDTAIRPLSDVDALVIFRMNPDVENPRITYEILDRVVRYIYRSQVVERIRMVDGRSPLGSSFGASTLVHLPDMRLEIIPGVFDQRRQGNIVVPNRNLRRWIPTNHETHALFTDDFDKATGGAYTSLVRIMKWWHHHNTQQRHYFTGFALECLVAAYAKPSNDALLTSFNNVLREIREKRQKSGSLRQLPEPGVSNAFKATFISESNHRRLISLIDKTLAQIDEVSSAPNLSSHIEVWRSIFGSEFPERLD